MAGFYESMAATVTTLLQKYGTTLQVQRDQSKFDPVESENYGAPPITVDMLGAFPKISRGYPHFDEVQEGDRLVVVDAAVKPLPTDKLLIDGQPWSILNIDEMNPAGTPLAYFFLARK